MEQEYGTRNFKIRSKILQDFLNRQPDYNLQTDYASGLLMGTRKHHTLDLDYRNENDDVSSEHELSGDSSPKIISEKHEEESLEDDYNRRGIEYSGDGFEKEDTPKSGSVSERVSGAKDHIQTLERIVKILELSSDTVKAIEPTEKDDDSFMKSMGIPENKLTQQNLIVIFFLFCFFVLFSILKISFYFLDILKTYFEKGLILNWSWMKKHFTISKPDGDRNLLSFLIIAPMLIIFLITYTGLYIVLLLHKIVLDSVPDSIQEKINCGHWFQKFMVEK